MNRRELLCSTIAAGSSIAILQLVPASEPVDFVGTADDVRDELLRGDPGKRTFIVTDGRPLRFAKYTVIDASDATIVWSKQPSCFIHVENHAFVRANIGKLHVRSLA